MSRKVVIVVTDVDKAMVMLRNSMKGLHIRFAGFKRDHDRLAKAMSNFTVTLMDAQPLMASTATRRRGRR